MSNRIISYNNFSSGILTPRLHSRTGTKEYDSGLEDLENALVYPHGSVARRNGSKFKAVTKSAAVDSRLIKYQINRSIAFIIELGDSYMRFYNSTGQVLESNKTITGITQANPGVVTSVAHGFSNGDWVYITGVVGMTQVNSSTIPYIVANVAADTFELTDIDGNNVNTSSYTAYSSGGIANRIYTISTPYDSTEIDAVQYAQSSTAMYLVHPSNPVYQLTRTTDTNWTLAAADFQPVPTYEAGYLPAATLTPGATSGNGVTFTAGSAVFLPGDVGRQIENLAGAGRASIVSYTSTTVVVADIIEAFPSTSAIASQSWKLTGSPVVDLEFDSMAEGSIINIRSEYPAGSLGDRVAISAITNASPGVVTTSSNHGLVDGDKIQIQDVVGMTQLNDKIFTVNVTAATTFELIGENTTGYTAYASGGIVRQRLTDINLGAFRSADVGKYILANNGVLKITAVTASDNIQAEAIKGMDSLDATGNWTLEEPTWSSARGYPTAIGFYQQRLWLGGTTAQPTTIWGSELGIFDGFGAGANDGDSIEIDLDSNEVNSISWIRGGRDLAVGTTGEELTISSSSASGITPSSIRSTPRSTQGSASQQTLKIGDEIIFIDSTTNDLVSFSYDFNTDGYRDANLLFLAEHLPKEADGLKEIAYAKSPDSVIYSVCEDGTMLASTYDRALKVIGTSKFTTYGSYERVMVLPTSGDDQVWVVTRRKINGIQRRYIEVFVPGQGLIDTDAFSDCFLTLSVPLTITAVTAANPAVVTSSSHGLSNGDTVIIKGIEDPEDLDLDSTKTNMSDLNDGVYTVANVAANTFELSGVNTSAYNAYGSGGFAYERVTTLSGLKHLEGKTVQIKTDGSSHADKTVSSGSLTLDVAAGEVVVGLAYTTTIKTLAKDFDIGQGSMLGQRAQWVRPLVRVNNSVPPLMNGAFLPARNTDDDLGQKIPLRTGYLEYGALTFDNTTSITLTTSDPFPLELTGITGKIAADVK
jgi:PIN domain nuclease of toxin-antitoxin system